MKPWEQPNKETVPCGIDSKMEVMKQTQTQTMNCLSHVFHPSDQLPVSEESPEPVIPPKEYGTLSVGPDPGQITAHWKLHLTE